MPDPPLIAGNGKDIFVLHSDAKVLLERLDPNSTTLIVTDPPWNTGQVRRGSAGLKYDDKHEYVAYKTLMIRLFEASFAALNERGMLALWLDWRWVHEAAVWGDGFFGGGDGRGVRVGEIIVHSELGNPGKSAWPLKHSTILLFAKNPDKVEFNYEGLPMVDRKAPKSGHGQKYATEGKRATSVLSATMSNTDPERVGYPDQKPSWVYRALIECYTKPGDLVVDPFMGSGTLGRAAKGTGRVVVLGDLSLDACKAASLSLELTENT